MKKGAIRRKRKSSGMIVMINLILVKIIEGIKAQIARFMIGVMIRVMIRYRAILDLRIIPVDVLIHQLMIHIDLTRKVESSRISGRISGMYVT